MAGGGEIDVEGRGRSWDEVGKGEVGGGRVRVDAAGRRQQQSNSSWSFFRNWASNVCSSASQVWVGSANQTKASIHQRCIEVPRTSAQHPSQCASVHHQPRKPIARLSWR